MPKNKKYIDDVLKELKKEYKPFYTSSLYEVAETTATASIKKQQMWNKLFQERENKFFEMLELVKQKLQKVEEHETENGYCCACEYDIACMNEKIEIAVQRKVEEIREMVVNYDEVYINEDVGKAIDRMKDSITDSLKTKE